MAAAEVALSRNRLGIFEGWARSHPESAEPHPLAVALQNAVPTEAWHTTWADMFVSEWDDVEDLSE
jgi:hypothetical protein